MEEVCPACNGLTNLSATCPFCGEPMTDAGSVNNYFGPYSPYMDEDSLNLVSLWTPHEFFNDPAGLHPPDTPSAPAESGGSSESKDSVEDEEPIPCVHLMTCSHCGWDTRVPVSHVLK